MFPTQAKQGQPNTPSRMPLLLPMTLRSPTCSVWWGDMTFVQGHNIWFVLKLCSPSEPRNPLPEHPVCAAVQLLLVLYM